MDNQDLLAQVNDELEKKRNLLKSETAAAYENKPISVQDALLQGLVQLVPGIVGYGIAGTEGGLAGFTGGQAGGDQYLEAVRNKLKAEQNQALATAANTKEQVSGLEKRSQGLEDRIALNAQKAQEAEASVDIAGRKAEAVEKAKIAARKAAKEAGSPLAQSGFEAMAAGKKPSPEELSAMFDSTDDPEGLAKNLADLGIRQQWADTSKGQLDLAKERESTKQGEKSVELLGVAAKTPKEAQQLRTAVESHRNLRKSIDKLELSLQQNGDSISGPGADQQRFYMAQLLLDLKESKNLGAAFTKEEIAILSGALPKIIQNPNNSFAAVELDKVLGKSPIYKLKLLRDNIDFTVLNKASSASGRPLGDISSAYFIGFDIPPSQEITKQIKSFGEPPQDTITKKSVEDYMSLSIEELERLAKEKNISISR